MLAAGHRLVEDADVGGEADLVQCCSKLVVKERARSWAILSPPARMTFGVPQRSRRKLELHGMARSLAQSSSSLTTWPASSSFSASSIAA